jgi:colanic acid/amylovoran biosynthesis glycosyltransferase
MKIFYLLRYFPTVTETFIYTEITELINAGIEIEIIALSSRDDGKLQDNIPKCPIHYIPKNRIKRLFPANTHGEKWLLQHQRHKDVVRLSWLRKFVTKNDHLHIHFAGEAAEIAYALQKDIGVSYSITTHAVDIFCPRRAWKQVLQAANTVITVSNYNQRYLQQHSISSTVVYCGINENKWPALPYPTDQLKALFIGRDVAKKGLDVLLEAFEQINHPHQLRVVSERSAVSTDKIAFLGMLNTTEVQHHMKWCNVVVLPCRISDNGDQDGIPIVLMEALASGRPVITTSLSGIPELITNEVGWLAKPNDVTSLLRCLTMATDPTLRSLKASRARDHILQSNFISSKQKKALIPLLLASFS